MKCCQRAELFGDDIGHMIGQHDAARPDPDPLRAIGHIADDHRGGGARDAGHVVVLGHPVAGEAPLVGVPGEVERVAECVGGGVADAHGNEVQDG